MAEMNPLRRRRSRTCRSATCRRDAAVPAVIGSDRVGGVMANVLSAMTVVQASVGGREQELQALQSTTQNNSLQTQSDLSSVTGIDMAGTISKFELTQNTLQAAQQSFARIEGMSLF